MKKIAFAAIISLLASMPAHAGAYEDMLEAIIRGNASEVAEIIKMGLDPNIVDKQGNTLLILAVREDDEAIVGVLLAAKANPNMVNAAGDTPLRLAAFRGALPVVQKLVKGRALVNIPDWSPLMYAAYNGHAPVVNYLLENGAEVNAQARNGFTALIAAAKGGYENIVITLLKRGAKPNLVTDRGETAMDFALRTDNTDIYDRLHAVGGLSGQAISSSPAK